MPETPIARDRYILDAIRTEAIRMEQAGHGLDYTCRLTDRQFDEVRAALGESGYSHWRSLEGESFRVASCVVGRVYGVCLTDDGKDREGVELTPGLRFSEWRIELS